MQRQREQPDLHLGQARAERVQLARRQTRRRKRQKVFAAHETEAVEGRPDDTTPGRTEPTPKAATAGISGPDLQRLEAQISTKRDQTRDELRDAEAAVADLRQRLTTLDTAVKAIEQVIHRLGLSRRSARPVPTPRHQSVAVEHHA